ncbi:hypothetical protein FRC16_005675 [Serendipita sp. 398]|nr:hypothetical protein FRC16_005675 [Serendipita sp. 398]
MSSSSFHPPNALSRKPNRHLSIIATLTRNISKGEFPTKSIGTGDTHPLGPLQTTTISIKRQRRGQSVHVDLIYSEHTNHLLFSGFLSSISDELSSFALPLVGGGGNGGGWG